MVDAAPDPDDPRPAPTVEADAAPPDDRPPLAARHVRTAQIALVAIAVIVVGIVLVSRGGDDDAPATSAPAGAGAEAAAGDATTTTATARPEWPAALRGRPPALGVNGQGAAEVTPTATAAPGIYVWGDFDGMHVWVVAGDGVPPVSGTIESDDQVQKAIPAIEGAGEVTVDGTRATFSLPGTAPIEGVDFNPGFYASKVVVTLQGPDGPIDPTLVRYGKDAEQAPFPLVIEKAVP